MSTLENKIDRALVKALREKSGRINADLSGSFPGWVDAIVEVLNAAPAEDDVIDLIAAAVHQAYTLSDMAWMPWDDTAPIQPADYARAVVWALEDNLNQFEMSGEAP